MNKHFELEKYKIIIRKKLISFNIFSLQDDIAILFGYCNASNIDSSFKIKRYSKLKLKFFEKLREAKVRLRWNLETECSNIIFHLVVHLKASK